MTKPLFILAPMDDVTDTVFRQIVAECAPADYYVTEFVNVDGLQSAGRKNTLRKLRFSESETSLIAQLWGKEPSNFYKSAKQIADNEIAKELGLPKGHNYVGVDLNMGCPQKSEVKAGTCAALMNNRPLASQIINETKRGLSGKLPLSVKTRLGFNEVDLSWIEFLLEHKLDMLTIHARTKKEKSLTPAHWEHFKDIVALRDKISPNTKIIGNGDIDGYKKGLELINKYKLDGVMIGRGVLNDPFVFSDKSPWNSFSSEQKINLFKKHIELFEKTWVGNERPIKVLNRFCKLYINDFSGAKQLRIKLMETDSLESLKLELDNYKNDYELVK